MEKCLTENLIVGRFCYQSCQKVKSVLSTSQFSRHHWVTSTPPHATIWRNPRAAFVDYCIVVWQHLRSRHAAKCEICSVSYRQITEVNGNVTIKVPVPKLRQIFYDWQTNTWQWILESSALTECSLLIVKWPSSWTFQSWFSDYQIELESLQRILCREFWLKVVNVHFYITSP